MSGGLPATIDPIRLADRGARLSGELSLRGMSRLGASLREEGGTALLDLEFRRDPERGARRVRGTISASVVGTCERCLEPLPLNLAADVDLLIVPKGNGRDMDETADVLEAGAPIALRDLAENELVLALPMIPKHALDACPAAQWIEGREEAGEAHHPAGIKPGDARR